MSCYFYCMHCVQYMYKPFNDIPMCARQTVTVSPDRKLSTSLSFARSEEYTLAPLPLPYFFTACRFCARTWSILSCPHTPVTEASHWGSTCTLLSACVSYLKGGESGGLEGWFARKGEKLGGLFKWSPLRANKSSSEDQLASFTSPTPSSNLFLCKELLVYSDFISPHLACLCSSISFNITRWLHNSQKSVREPQPFWCSSYSDLNISNSQNLHSILTPGQEVFYNHKEGSSHKIVSTSLTCTYTQKK